MKTIIYHPKTNELFGYIEAGNYLAIQGDSFKSSFGKQSFYPELHTTLKDAKKTILIELRETFNKAMKTNSIVDKIKHFKIIMGNEDQKPKYSPVHLFMYFSMNYYHGFIADVWKHDKHMADHFQDKFQGYYNEHGSMGVFSAFYCGMSPDHQTTLENWIIANFKG